MGTYKYSAEFRADAVALARSSGRPVSRIAAELGVNHETLRQWIKTAENAERPEALAESTRDAEIAALRKQVRELEMERDILRRAAKYCGRDELVSRFEFVADRRGAFGVKRLCTVLNLSRSGFYRWLKTAPTRAAKKAADAALTRRIRTVHTESGKTYGAKRITAELRAGGVMVNRKRIERLMRQHSIQGRMLRRRHRTTIPDPAAQAVPDLLRRNFTAPAPDRAWIGDITYLPLAGGSFLYLATVIDVFSRRLLGWSMAGHMRAELVTDALNAAIRTRGGQVDGVIFHSDHGAQHGSKAFADACYSAGIRWSMGAVGTSADNAAAESFFASLKREILPGRHGWPTARAARLAVFRWLGFYNHRRRHSTIGYLAPVAFEQRSITLAIAA
ncbi:MULTISPECIES: IS3 family transposase [unclassified Streptomyces]|uniref:IS3 family transposase n=1 Tax=unclassified Streptomyces TaxID=2593676 RepID=UPI001EDBC97C|nr:MULTISPECIES: IS3 family transposase [unclassified Streptomyces]UKL04175.1 IS3 family transposase [Streptomyces sp. NBU3104]